MRTRHPSRFRGCRASPIESLENRYLLSATPIITEFMASNPSFYPSAVDGGFHDWIEIYNPGPGEVDLQGWYLTDDKQELDVWQFPSSYVLGEDQFLVVFASGFNLGPTNEVNEFHTNFRLSREGEYLALVQPDGATVNNEFEPQYPVQTDGVSYGLTADLIDEAFFVHPTPGAHNPVEFKDSVFYPHENYFDQPIKVALDVQRLHSPVHYTLDGSVPTPEDPIYDDWIPVTNSTTIRAKSFANNADGKTYTRTFLFPTQLATTPHADSLPANWIDRRGNVVVADYEMDVDVTTSDRFRTSITDSFLSLPTLAIHLDAEDLFAADRGIYANPTDDGRDWERIASVELLHPSGRTGFQVDAGIRIRGGASREPTNTPKHSFRLYFRGEYGVGTLDEPLFESDAGIQFDRLELNAGYNDSWLSPESQQRSQATLIRDAWLRQTLADMGQLSVSGEFFHLMLNGIYWGIYNATERVDDAFAAEHWGGQRSDYDIIDAGEVDEGSADGWNQLLAAGRAISVDPTAYQQVHSLMDVDNFVDFMLLRIYAGDRTMADGDWFAIRNRQQNGPFHFLVVDGDSILREASDQVTDQVSADPAQQLFLQLQQVPEFRLAFADRWHLHTAQGGALSVEQNQARWDRLANQLRPGVLAESARWGDHRRDVQSNDVGPVTLYNPIDHWEVEVQRIQQLYFPERQSVVRLQLREMGLDSAVPPPAFDQPSGEIVDNMQLQISSSVSDSEIYFTVDGNDPMTSDGQLADSALRYEQALPIDTTMRVIARVRQAGEWSGATMADYFVPLALQVTEIQAKAMPSADFAADDYDFLELMNTGEFPIDLSAVRFVRGIRFEFQSAEIRMLEPQQRIVLVQNRQAFLQRYPEAASRVAGTYSGRLKGRDTLLAVGEWDRSVIHFTYDTDWYKIADDEFFSLVLQDEFMDVDASDVVRMADPSRWRPSHYVNGSPGTSDPGYAQNAIVISEALTHSDGDPGDYLELHNTTDHDIDLSGWYLSGRASQLDLYRIADGTILPAHGFLYFSATAPPVPTQNFGGIMGFNISKLGEKIYVTSAGRSPEELGGYRYVAKFGYGFNSSSFILHTNSVGEQEYLIALERTPGFPNGSPVAVERLRDNERPFREAVINEVMYFPQGNGDEFIELYNPHRTPAYLNQPFGPSWRLTEGVFLDLPATAIPPFHYALLVGIDPDTFRQKYSVPEDVAIFGPYAGEMLNSGERIVLSRAAGPTSIIPFSVTDQLHYNSPAAAWPEQAKGHGASLVRNSLRMQGNDPLAWSAGNDGGTPGRPNQRWDESSFIVDRMLFYNDSRFDDNNPAISGADQLAIAVDKFAMNPGDMPQFVNYTSYDKGINGLMIDMHGLPGEVTLEDFEFRVGQQAESVGDVAPTPKAFQVLAGQGYDHADRIVFTWDEGAIRNEWLQVTVKANNRTGLIAEDVFLFGNLVGETGDSLDERRVDEIDRHRILASIMANNLIETTYLFDINRDGKVDQRDADIVTANFADANHTPWQNSIHRLDVNADGHVSPIDALEVINRLNTLGAGSLDASQEIDAPPPYLDVNGDNFVSPIDALDVINFLNADGDA